ncbi:hypothetical protein V6N13_090773 [Hibiscus sabdariffa]
MKSMMINNCPELEGFICTSSTEGNQRITNQVLFDNKALDFKNLTALEVEECNSLKYIFSVSMALDFVQLERITVKNCPKMEYIIKKGAEETAMDTVWLPKLETITLESCSELKSFYYSAMSIFV